MIGLSRNSREPSEESLIFEDVPLPIISREETIRSRYHIPSSVVIVEKPLLTSLNTSNENGKKDLISLLSNSPETVTPLSMDELARLKESQYDQISAKEVSSAAGEARNIKNLKKRSRKLRTLLRTLNESTSTESVIEQDFLRAMKVQIYVLVDNCKRKTPISSSCCSTFNMEGFPSKVACNHFWPLARNNNGNFKDEPFPKHLISPAYPLVDENPHQAAARVVQAFASSLFAFLKFRYSLVEISAIPSFPSLPLSGATVEPFFKIENLKCIFGARAEFFYDNAGYSSWDDLYKTFFSSTEAFHSICGWAEQYHNDLKLQQCHWTRRDELNVFEAELRRYFYTFEAFPKVQSIRCRSQYSLVRPWLRNRGRFRISKNPYLRN